MKGTKKVIASLVVATMLLVVSNSVIKAASIPSVTKSLTITTGSNKTIKVKGTGIKSKTFKSTNTKIAEVNKKGVVTAKNAGNCKVKVTVKYIKNKKSKKVSTKILTTKVTVKAVSKPEVPNGQITGNDNADEPEPTEISGDKELLSKIIEEQRALGANLPFIDDKDDYDVNLYYDNNDSYNDYDVISCNYGWSKDGYLKHLLLDNNDLKETLSLSGFKKLEYVSCEENQLTNLDVSGCLALEVLDCEENQLTSLDVSGCLALKYLNCSNTKLTSLDVSNCPALEKLYCDEDVNLIGVPDSCEVINDDY